MEPTSIARRHALVAGAAASIDIARAQSRSHHPVVLGQVSLSFYAVTGAVVHQLLERLGHAVELRTGPHDQMFPLLGQGSIDLMAAAWLPEGHAAYWSQYGTAALEVARLYTGAHFFWAVPEYVPQDEVATIGDLTKRGVAQRMTRQIQGIGPAATITTVSQAAVRSYGLDARGYTFHTGTQAEWIEAHDAAMSDGRWFVFPTWAPHYLNRGGRLRALRDPQGVLGGMNHGALVAPVARWQGLPAATTSALSRIDLGLDGVSEMDAFVNIDKLSPREAARRWMQANAARVEAWLRG
jgi:glycine betaine/proline transport system substrate-binding protein